MKKTLFATTALATAGLLALSAGDAYAQAAAPAAEKLKISVGGFMLQTFGWADNKTDDGENAGHVGHKGFDTKNDSEIFFRGSVKLDSGLTVGVDVQLEGDPANGTAGNPIDEGYMTIGSATLGTIYLGSTDNMAGRLNIQAPWTGALNPYTGDMGAWVIDSGGNANGISTGENAGGAADDSLVGYLSPSFAGFRVGLGYTASTTESGTQPTASEGDQWDGGVQYAGKFGDFGVRASAIYYKTDGGTDTTQVDGWAIGGDVTYANFTFGGGYGEIRQDGDVVLGAAVTAADTDTWNIGVKYAPGPFAVAVTYGHASAPGTSGDTDDETEERWILGGSYTLGPGVNLVGNVIRITHDTETDNATTENKGWAVVGGINVDF
jgi:predicted porin